MIATVLFGGTETVSSGGTDRRDKTPRDAASRGLEGSPSLPFGVPASGGPQGTWNVIVTRLDRSKFNYSERHLHAPIKGALLERRFGGRLIKSEIQAIHHNKPKFPSLDVWTIEATEI
jgi:hypothetical protein